MIPDYEPKFDAPQHTAFDDPLEKASLEIQARVDEREGRRRERAQRREDDQAVARQPDEFDHYADVADPVIDWEDPCLDPSTKNLMHRIARSKTPRR